MDTRYDVEQLRKRITALEREVAEVRVRADGLAAQLREAAPGAPVAAAEVAVDAPPPGAPGGPELAPVTPPALPGSVEVLATATAVAPVVPPAPPRLVEPPRLHARAAERPEPPRIAAPTRTWREEEPTGPTRAQKLKAALESMQLWPPSGESNAEVRLGAWWATRLGVGCLVICAVFFGVYFSRGSGPWVKLAELGGAVALLGGLGLWLEKRVPRFGAVLVGGALAVGYFVAYGAYAITPLRVLESAAAGALWQLVAAAGILSVAWRRQSEPTAVMAVALGFVAAGFSIVHGLPEWGLVSGLGLAGVALVARRRLAWETPAWVAWETPAWVAMPLAWVLLAATGWKLWLPLDGPLTAWSWTAAYAAVFLLRDVPWRRAGTGTTAGAGAMSAIREGAQLAGSAGVLDTTTATAATAPAALRTFLGLHVTAALAVGAGLTWWVAREHLDAFYFVSGAAVLALALAARRVWPAEALVTIWLAKATSLIGLGVITAFEGRTRWIVLLVQAITMTLAARRTQSRTLWWLGAGVAGVAAWFFREWAGVRPDLALASVEGGVAMLFVLGWLVWAGLAERTAPDAEAGRLVTVAGALGGAALITLLAWTAQGGTWTPVVLLAGLAAVLAGASRLAVRAPAWAAGGGWLALVALALIGAGAPGVLPWSERSVMLAAFVAGSAALAAGAEMRWRETGRGLGAALAVLGILAVMTPGWRAMGWTPALAAIAAAGWGFAATPRRLQSAWLGAGALLLAAQALVVLDGSLRGWPLLANVTVVLAVVGGAAVVLGRRARAAMAAADWRALAGLVVWPAVAMGLVALRRETDGPWTTLVSSVVATVLVLGARRAMAFPLRAAAVVAAGVGAWSLLDRGVELAPAAAVWWSAAVLAWVPAVALRRDEQREGGPGAAPRWMTAVLLAIATAAWWTAVTQTTSEGALQLALGALGVIVAAALAKAVRLDGAWAVATVLVGLTALAVPLRTLALAELAAVAGCGCVALGVPWAARRLAGDPWPQWRRAAVWVHGGAVLVTWLYASGAGPAALAPYATAGWGLTAVGLFVAGLFGRERPWRWLALGVAALAMVRLFVVDLDSTLGRIVAFFAVGVALLWVGFSYHRFRHLIVEEERGS